MTSRANESYSSRSSSSGIESVLGITSGLSYILAKGVGISALKLAASGENAVTRVANSRLTERILASVSSVLDHDLGGRALQEVSDSAPDIASPAKKLHRLDAFVLGSCGWLGFEVDGLTNKKDHIRTEFISAADSGIPPGHSVQEDLQ